MGVDKLDTAPLFLALEIRKPPTSGWEACLLNQIGQGVSPTSAGLPATTPGTPAD